MYSILSASLERQRTKNKKSQCDAIHITIDPQSWKSYQGIVIGRRKTAEPWIIVKHPQPLEHDQGHYMMEKECLSTLICEYTEPIVVELETRVKNVVNCANQQVHFVYIVPVITLQQQLSLLFIIIIVIIIPYFIFEDINFIVVPA